MSLPIPLRDRILVRRSDAEQRTPGGLIVPDSAKEKLHEGTVVDVGPGGLAMDGTVVPLAVKAGDKIAFMKGTGVELRDSCPDDPALLILRENDVLCVLSPAPVVGSGG